MFPALLGISLAVAVTVYMLLQKRSRYPKVCVLAPENARYKKSYWQPMSGTAEFRGIVLTPGSDCCNAAATLSKVTFARNDKLRFPLVACDKKVCKCQTRIIKDRRKSERRIHADRRSKVRFGIVSHDRRLNNGRRRSDSVWSNGCLR